MHFARRQSLIVAVAFLIPLLLLAGDLFAHPQELVCGLARRLCLAGHPYLDVCGLASEYWDWSTPSALGFARLCSSFGLINLSAGTVAYVILLALVLSAVALTACLNGRGPTWPLALALAWGLLATRFSFGDSQTILAVAILPWLIMRWCRYENTATANGGARACQVMALLLAFIALSMDPLFLLVLLFAETYLILASGRFLWNAPLALLASLAVYFVSGTYAAYLPWRLSNCLSFDEALVVPQSAPDQSAWFYALGLVLVLLVLPGRSSSLPRLLVSVALAGMVLFILEGSGLSCDLQLMVIYLILAAVSAFAGAGSRPKLWLCLSILVSAGLWGWLNQCHSLAVVEDMSQTLQHWSRPRQIVAVYADWPQSAYPLLLNSGRQSGYLSFARPLRLPLEELKAPILARLAYEMKAKKAALVLLESPRLENLFESYGLLALLKAHYRQVGYCMRSGNSAACECPRGTTRFSIWVPL